MKSRLNQTDNLKKVVEDVNLTQVKVPYIEVHYTSLDNEDNNNLQFPVLTMEDISYKLRTLPDKECNKLLC